MTEMIAKLSALRVTSDSRVATFGSIIIYIGGIAFCILACRQMLDLNLNETQTTFGLLLVVCATMLMIVVGMLLRILGRLSDTKSEPGFLTDFVATRSNEPRSGSLVEPGLKGETIETIGRNNRETIGVRVPGINKKPGPEGPVLK